MTTPQTDILREDRKYNDETLEHAEKPNHQNTELREVPIGGIHMTDNEKRLVS
jgi:hypothetical protein